MDNSRDTNLARGVPTVALEGRHVLLRPVYPSDYEQIRTLELSSDLVTVWRHGGTTPSSEQFAASLWAGVLAQFLVVAKPRLGPLGLVCIYNPSFEHGHAYLAAAKFQPRRRSPLFLQGAALFLDYAFANWNFRKLYAETNELNIGQFRSGLEHQLFIEEGRLLAHRFFAGRYWDNHLLALYRERWEAFASEFRELLAASAGSGR